MNFLKQLFNKLQPDKFFLVSATILGLIFLVLIPPFQTRDEINHFYRSYQMADGYLLARSYDNKVGGDIPKSLVALADSNSIKKFDIPLNPAEKDFVDFSNTALYAPVSYAPQAAVLYYFKPFELSPLVLFYAARFAMLLFWIVGIYYAIGFIPFYKWAFTLLALIPMFAVHNLSISGDMVTNVLAFFSMAYIYKLAYEEPMVSRKQFLLLCVLTFLVTSAKIIYIPLLLVVLFIPKEKFGTIKVYYVRLLTLAILASVTALYWLKAMKDLSLMCKLYNPKFDNLGWLDAHLPVWFIALGLVFMLLVVIRDGKKEVQFTLMQKGIWLASFLSILILILLSQHLTWSSVGADTINSIQGRYFIPVAPLLFLIFYNRKFMYSKRVVYLVIIFSVFSLILVVNVLYDKYFSGPKVIETIEITCNAENKAEGNWYKSNLPQVFFENSASQSNEKSRSGTYSAKVNSKDPFTFTHRLFGCGKGDKLSVEVWRLGKNGRISLVNNSHHLNAEVSDPIEKDSAGWERLQLDYVVPENLIGDTLTIYLFNNAQDSTYFDDMRIIHSRIE